MRPGSPLLPPAPGAGAGKKVVLVLVVLVLLSGLGGLGYLTYLYVKPGGAPQQNAVMADECALGQEVLMAAKTTNRYSSGDNDGDLTCDYKMVEGEDGTGFRLLRVSVGPSRYEWERTELAENGPNVFPGMDHRSVSGLGDVAGFGWGKSNGEGRAWLLVHADGKRYSLSYSMVDYTFLRAKEIPPFESTFELLRTAAEELIAKG